MYGQRLDVCLVLGELLSRPMQQADMRVGALDDLAVEFQHQSQHAVRRRVLGAKVHRVVLDFSHEIQPDELGRRLTCRRQVKRAARP
jgi:hypothetical protein